MVTALSPAAYIGFITLAPAVVGVIIIALGFAGRATRPIVLALSVVGAVVPAVGLLFLAPEVAFGEPIAVRPFGLGVQFTAWIAPTYRLDAFAVTMAVGVAFIVVPLLIWMGFAEPSQSAEVDGSADTPVTTAPVTEPVDVSDAGDTSVNRDASVSPSIRVASGGADQASRPLVLTAGLTLAFESAALTLVFADSLVLLGIAWLLLAALAWGLGEAASDTETVDRLGLGVTLLGPALWLVVMLFPAAASQSHRLIELTGRTALSPLECILLALALALAGGAYPAIAWVRRRAALATPSGIAALVMGVLPAVVYVAARTYAVAADGANQWPLFGATPPANTAPPPINVGVVYVALGAATVAISGLLALGRRDGRALVALLGVAQVGWGLVGVGIGRPESVLGVVLLLPSAVLGLGAMLAALVAGGALTSDVEPDAAGPRPFGAPARPIALLAWSVGAGTLVAAPFFAGFAPRHLMSAGALQVGTLTIPLVGLCWAGDVLLGLALVRATAPALANWTARLPGTRAALSRDDLRDVPAGLLAALALVAGVSPALMIAWFGSMAVGPLLTPASLSGKVALSIAGYTIGPAQWFGTLAWVAVVVMVLVVLIVRPGGPRAVAPVFIGGRTAAATAESVRSQQPTDVEADTAPVASEALALAEPIDAWSDLARAFDSPWILPAEEWLLLGIDDTDGDEVDDESDDSEDSTIRKSDGADSVSVSTVAKEVLDGDK